MQRIFRDYDYAATYELTLRVGDVLPAEHPACCLVAFLATVDLTALYDLYYPIGPHPYDPRVMLTLWLYGYMHGVTSSRSLARATYEQLPFVYVAAGQHPFHTALAEFRTLVFAYLPTLFEDLLLRAKQDGFLTLQAVSQDGTKIHADASKHQAVSYQRAGELIHELQAQIEDLLQRAQDAPTSLPAEMILADEIAMRRARIARLQEARTVLEARADERYAADLAEYEAQVAARTEKERLTGRKPRGKPFTPPTPGPADTDQYNFTDPDARIMKNSTNTGFDQHYNAQATIDHDSRLIVGCALSNHPADRGEALSGLDDIPASLGVPKAACLDNGYWSPTNVELLLARDITPYIAVMKLVHGWDWQHYFHTTLTTPPPDDANPLVKMAYQLQTQAGQDLYRLRKSTIEPTFGIIKEVFDFRQFSLRGLAKALGEWRLVCLAYNFKRFFKLQAARRAEQAQESTQTEVNPREIAETSCFARLWRRIGGGARLWRVAPLLALLAKPTARRWAAGC